MTGSSASPGLVDPPGEAGRRTLDGPDLRWEPSRMGPDRPAGVVDVVDELDADSRQWLDRLMSPGPTGVEAIHALFDLLHRAALHECGRRRGTLPATLLADLDDVARQAADDAVAAVLRKLPEYRGRSRFTTWAYKFVVYELSTTLRREAWRGRSITMADTSWERIVDEAPFDPVAEAEGRELIAAVHRVVNTSLTRRQRDVFVAVAILHAPIDAIAERHNSSRGAIYKVLHDAREKLRGALDAEGWRLDDGGRRH